MLRYCVNLFWLAFVLDGVLSFVAELASRHETLPWLGMTRSLLAFFVILASLVMAGLLAGTPRAPKRVLAPMILFAWWTGPGRAFPLEYWNIPHLLLWLAAAQVLVGAGLMLLFGFRANPKSGRSFLHIRSFLHFPFAVHAGRDVFRWKHSLIAAPITLLVAVGFATMSLCLSLATGIESLSGGYVRIHPDGIYLVERQFQSGDREVWLTGMIHIAQGDFYSDVLPEADPDHPALVLVEGVTDHKGLLSKDEMYGDVADILNVTAQNDSVFTKEVTIGLHREKEAASRQTSTGTESAPEAGEQEMRPTMAFKHADVDVASFHPKTIAFLVAVMSVFHSHDFVKTLKMVFNPASPLNDESAQAQVMQDILHSRSDRVVDEIQLALPKYDRIIVPWGALHLPEIEAWLRTQHFQQCAETERKALSFW